MLSHDVTSIAGKNKTSKRIGRGQGSGHGKTSGRGHKGSGSRPGSFTRATYEGGQMPLFRRIPKRGFNNYNFAKTYEIVNLKQLDIFFEDGATVDVDTLFKAGLVNDTKSKIKILGDGELSKKLQVSANKFSKSAEKKISDCGGTVKVVA